MEYDADILRYSNGMEYRRCGKSGLMLPVLSLGLWHNFGTDCDLKSANAMLCRAFDMGITYFDLANNYGPIPGSAEENFGKLLKQDFLPYRDELIVSTKAGHRMWDGPYGDGSSRKNLIASLNQSLKRMQLDYVDIFYSHRYDGVTPIEETMQALVDIVHSGKALYIGISKYPPKEAQFAYDYLKAANVPCLVHQVRFNMFTREAEEETIPLAAKNGVGFVAFSPLAQGLLSDRYLNGIPDDSRAAKGIFLKPEAITSEVLYKMEHLNRIAQSRDQSLAQMALAWTLQKPSVTSLVIGASSVAQLNNNLDTLKNLEFSKDELREIERVLNYVEE